MAADNGVISRSDVMSRVLCGNHSLCESELAGAGKDRRKRSGTSCEGDPPRDADNFGAGGKIHIVMEGLRGGDSIAELRRREGIVENLYYRSSKEFPEEEA